MKHPSQNPSQAPASQYIHRPAGVPKSGTGGTEEEGNSGSGSSSGGTTGGGETEGTVATTTPKPFIDDQSQNGNGGW